MAGVTNDQLAALQAYLLGDADNWQRLHQRLAENDGLDGYGELVYAAFVTAARNHFPPTWRVSDVIRYVAEVRGRIPEDPDAIEPRTAEYLIRRALGDNIKANIDANTNARAQVLLLAALVEDQDHDAEGLDRFLEDTHTLADRWGSADDG